MDDIAAGCGFTAIVFGILAIIVLPIIAFTTEERCVATKQYESYSAVGHKSTTTYIYTFKDGTVQELYRLPQDANEKIVCVKTETVKKGTK